MDMPQTSYYTRATATSCPISADEPTTAEGFDATNTPSDFTKQWNRMVHAKMNAVPAEGWVELVNESNTMKVVQIYIADPNINIPIERRLLYQSEKPFLTDATDQELLFEIDIKGMLDRHNAYRITVLDKEATKRAGRDVFLEPIKVRDLRMVIVPLAAF